MIEKEGKVLISVCSKVIGLPIECIEMIVHKNRTAELFLQQEAALKINSDLENLEILVRLILFRDFGDLSKATLRDIEFIRENYGINVSLAATSKKNDYKISEIIKEFESERNNCHTMSEVLSKYQ